MPGAHVPLGFVDAGDAVWSVVAAEVHAGLVDEAAAGPVGGDLVAHFWGGGLGGWSVSGMSVGVCMEIARDLE